MATTTQRGPLEAATGGAGAEVVGGIGAVVLSIVGLANVVPELMLSIAGIVIGAAFVLEGAVIAAEYSRALSATETATQRSSEVGGLTIEMLAGLVGIVLGVLSIIGIDPQVLMAASAIVFGSALVLSSGAIARLNEIRSQTASAAGTVPTQTLMSAQTVVQQAVAAAAGAQVFTGLAAIVLGILALVNIQPPTLTLVALLAVAATILLRGSAIGSRSLSLLKWE